MKINQQALEYATKKLLKLRLTDQIPLMDDTTHSETVKSVLQHGLGGLYDDKALEYILKFGIKYYFEDLSK